MDIFGDSGDLFGNISKNVLQKDIPRYPYISKRYPSKISKNDILQCYLKYILRYPHFSNFHILPNAD